MHHSCLHTQASDLHVNRTAVKKLWDKFVCWLHPFRSMPMSWRMESSMQPSCSSLKTPSDSSLLIMKASSTCLVWPPPTFINPFPPPPDYFVVVTWHIQRFLNPLDSPQVSNWLKKKKNWKGEAKYGKCFCEISVHYIQSDQSDLLPFSISHHPVASSYAPQCLIEP